MTTTTTFHMVFWYRYCCDYSFQPAYTSFYIIAIGPHIHHGLCPTFRLSAVLIISRAPLFPSSETMFTPYCVGFLEIPGFSVEDPDDHPHIIDTDTYVPLITSTPLNLRLHEVVSTMLYKISFKTLENFYDTETNYGFCLISKFKHPRFGPEQRAIIRHGDNILVSVRGVTQSRLLTRLDSNLRRDLR
jgi:hypothetical protein